MVRPMPPELSEWAYIDESMRIREMLSGIWPVKFWPLRSLPQSTVAARSGRMHREGVGRADEHARDVADAPKVA